MFYKPSKNDHGLPFNPFKSCVVPRPIAWISSISRSGILNLAPYSQSNILGWDPPYVMFSAQSRPDGKRTDSVTNAEQTGEFVWNMATYELRDEVVDSSMIMDSDVDEIAECGLTGVESRLVVPPRLKESPINLECKHHQTLVLPNGTKGMFNSVVIGEVVGVHINDEFIGDDGKVDIVRVRPLTRLGYLDYSSITDVFEMRPAGISDETIGGMSGGNAARKG